MAYDREGADATYEWSETTPAVAVVETVAAAVGEDPLGVEPLFEAVDPEALNAVVRSADSVVSFRFAGCRVTVEAAGCVSVEPPSESAEGADGPSR